MRKSFIIGIFAAFAAMLCVSACTRDSDGPIPVSAEDDSYTGLGFFRVAVFDSNALIHLASDTLYLRIDSLWSYSNCALKRIEIDASRDGDALVYYPKIIIDSDGEDCPSPYLHPDTVIKLLPSTDELDGVSVLRVRNDEDKILDTVLLRRGKFEFDTFAIYVDSLFDTVSSLPLRTKDSPSVLKVLDSLNPRLFYWRAMEASCELRIDMCDSVVNDTLFPKAWSLTDTALVPIRKACASDDSTYCVANRWVNDSSSLGPVQERADTVWFTSIYYVEEIPECAAMNSFRVAGYALGKNVNFIRELMVPDESETACGPSALKDVYIYDIGRNRVYPDSLDADSLYGIWKSAKNAPKK